MDKEKKAIERVQFASKASLEIHGKPLVVAYSGGKDSDTLLEVVKRANVPFILEHSHTTADAPPTIYHTREVLHQLECDGIQCNVHFPRYKKQRTTLWAVIPEKGMPPTRLMRYCCRILKQTGKRESIVLTGVRWDESVSRKKTRGIFENNSAKKENRIVFREDDEETRKQYLEIMQKTTAVIMNPIVDWTNRELWDYIGAEKIKMNPLYERASRVLVVLVVPWGVKNGGSSFVCSRLTSRLTGGHLQR